MTDQNISVFQKLGLYKNDQVKSINFTGCCNRDSAESCYSGDNSRSNFWEEYEQYLMRVPASKFEWTLHNDGELSVYYLDPCESSDCEDCQEAGDAQ